MCINTQNICKPLSPSQMHSTYALQLCILRLNTILTDDSSYLSVLSTSVSSVLVVVTPQKAEESPAAGLTRSSSTFCISVVPLRVVDSKIYKHKKYFYCVCMCIYICILLLHINFRILKYIWYMCIYKHTTKLLTILLYTYFLYK